jgi:hypothetical protein
MERLESLVLLTHRPPDRRAAVAIANAAGRKSQKIDAAHCAPNEDKTAIATKSATTATKANTYGLKIAAPVVALPSSSVCAFAASFSA